MSQDRSVENATNRAALQIVKIVLFALFILVALGIAGGVLFSAL